MPKDNMHDHKWTRLEIGHTLMTEIVNYAWVIAIYMYIYIFT